MLPEIALIINANAPIIPTSINKTFTTVLQLYFFIFTSNLIIQNIYDIVKKIHMVGEI